MEDFIKDALPQEVIEVQEAISPSEPEGIGVGGCIGIGIGVVILAAVFAKLYKCTSKKK